MQLDSRPVPKEGVLVQEMAGTRLILDSVTGNYFTLDEVGSRVWSLCDGRSASSIVDVLCDEYDAPALEIRADVLDLLAELSQERLIRER